MDINYMHTGLADGKPVEITTKFVDDDEGGKIIGEHTLTGTTTDGYVGANALHGDFFANHQYTDKSGVKHNQYEIQPGWITGLTFAQFAYTNPGSDKVIHSTIIAHVKHCTDTVIDHKSPTRTIITINPDGTQTTEPQNGYFGYKVQIDFATGKTTFVSPTGTDPWFRYDLKTIAGYTILVDGQPATSYYDGQHVLQYCVPQVTPTYNTTDQIVHVTYQANSQTTKIFFEDHDGNPVGEPIEVEGHTDETVRNGSDYHANVPAGWQLVPGKQIPSTIHFTAAGHPDIHIEVKHAMIPVTPGELPHPGDKKPGTANKQPGDGQPKTTITYNDLHQSIIRTINVYNLDGTLNRSASQKQVATLTRQAWIDDVTGEVTYGEWSTGQWDEWYAPAIAGYHAFTPYLQGVIIHNGDENITYDIKYYPNWQRTHIIFKDDQGNVVGQPLEVEGHTDETVHNGRDYHADVPAGWVLDTGQTIPTEIVFGPRGHDDIIVTIHHQVLPVDHNHPLTPGAKTSTGQLIDGAHENDLNKTITRTIQVTKPDGTTTTTVQTAHIYRNATYDDVTGKVTYGNWSQDSNFWKEFTPVAVAGYTPSQSTVAAETVTSETTDQTVTITYTANQQTTHIIYVDKQGNTIKKDTVSGKTGETVDTKSTIPAGWQLATDQTPAPEKITFTADGHPDIYIKVEHATTFVPHDHPVQAGDKTPTGQLIDGAHENDLNKTITRTIKVTKPDGKTTTTVQTAHIYRNATYDDVTGEVTYGDWSEDHNDWTAVTPETIDGYTPVIKIDDQVVADIPAVIVKNGQQNVHATITYKANEQSVNVVYKDGHRTIKSVPLTGKTDQTVDVVLNVPANYHVTNHVPTTYTFKAKDNQDIIVELAHNTEAVSDSKTVTRTIVVTNPDETTHQTPQTVTLRRLGIKDLVTGDITWQDWSTGQWAAFNTPVIAGYTPSQSTVAAETVTSETTDQTVNITYVANDQAINVVYKDGHRTIKSVPLTGKTDQTVDVVLHVPDHYHVTNHVPTTYTFKANDNQDIIVELAHDTEAVSDSKTITRTIIVHLPDGSVQTYHQPVTLTRTGTKDLVTDQTSWQPWTTGNWDAFTVPQVDGYTASQDVVAQQQVTDGMHDVTINVGYSQTGAPIVDPGEDALNIVQYVDQDGRIIKTDRVSGQDGQVIPLAVPAGYHLVGAIPLLTISEHDLLHIVHVAKDVTPTPEQPQDHHGNHGNGNASQSQPGGTSATPTTTTNAVGQNHQHQSVAKLPQTGNDQADLAALGLAGMSLATMLGLSIKKRHE